MKKSFFIFAIASILILASSFDNYAAELPGDKHEQAKTTIEGKIVCIGCDLHHSEGANFQCSKYGHKGALKTSDGKIWSFVENDHAKKLINDKKLHGKAIKVTGKKIDKAMLIDVVSYEIDGKKMEWCEKCNNIGPKHSH